jgi:transcriptional regulator of acetoin/glycerol metabolism
MTKKSSRSRPTSLVAPGVSSGRVSEAPARLGISRGALYRKLSEPELDSIGKSQGGAPSSDRGHS